MNSYGPIFDATSLFLQLISNSSKSGEDGEKGMSSMLDNTLQEEDEDFQHVQITWVFFSKTFDPYILTP